MWRLLIIRYKSTHSTGAVTGYIRLINNDEFINLYTQHTEYESLINADLGKYQLIYYYY